jgi:hypothetical protein
VKAPGFRLESAWLQPLNLKCGLLVSKFAFKWVNLYRYAAVIDLKNNKKVVGAGAGGAGGADGGDQWGFPAALGKWLKSSAAVGDAAVGAVQAQSS